MLNTTKRVLVTGGGGYIGSHTCKALAARGWLPVTLDNFCTGHRWAVRWGPLVEHDLALDSGLTDILRQQNIDAVIHFAASAYVGESMLNPTKYFRNNVTSTLHLLEAMAQAGVQHLVFSSSCATYGVPERLPILESDAQRPTNPYGESKLMGERMIDWFGRLHGLRWTALRYFNAAGADPKGDLGEVHQPETHLIPLAIETAMGLRPQIQVFGSDYPTPDGTAVRDYVHVCDLADAHVQALDRLFKGGSNACFNLGTGQGNSVAQVIATVEAHTRIRLNVARLPRREGDPPILVASNDAAQQHLGWSPHRSSLANIVATAWHWHEQIQRMQPMAKLGS